MVIFFMLAVVSFEKYCLLLIFESLQGTFTMVLFLVLPNTKQFFRNTDFATGIQV